MTNDQKRRGRPWIGAEPKTAPINAHTTQRLKKRIQDAAKRHGRSISCEIEARLYFSFDAEDDAAARELAAVAIKQGANNGHR